MKGILDASKVLIGEEAQKIYMTIAFVLLLCCVVLFSILLFIERDANHNMKFNFFGEEVVASQDDENNVKYAAIAPLAAVTLFMGIISGALMYLSQQSFVKPYKYLTRPKSTVPQKPLPDLPSQNPEWERYDKLYQKAGEDWSGLEPDELEEMKVLCEKVGSDCPPEQE